MKEYFFFVNKVFKTLCIESSKRNICFKLCTISSVHNGKFLLGSFDSYFCSNDTGKLFSTYNDQILLFRKSGISIVSYYGSYFCVRMNGWSLINNFCYFNQNSMTILNSRISSQNLANLSPESPDPNTRNGYYFFN
jgi:hypothetical protein